MTARCIMVLGTTSNAGKSYLATGLCRWYANAGYRVAPFKAQNMSNNARVVVTPGGEAGEIGSAQYFQALAARATPDVRMNPVLLKPEADTRSQVVVLGRVRKDLADVPWRQRSDALWPFARQALHDLRATHDVVVIEGAGSPAEINLAASDFVNTRTAIDAQAACLLVTDIDRGGAFAHLHGTHALMDPGVRRLLRGFVLNKFRGDEALLAPGPEQLRLLTGVPTLAVLPMDRHHGLPEEDGVFDEGLAWPLPATAAGPAASRRATASAVAGAIDIPLAMPASGGPRGGHIGSTSPHRPITITIVIVAAPHISNLDEFQPLRSLPNTRVLWARDAAAIARADWLILPGSKHTRADLAWLREHGMHTAIDAHVRANRPLLAICGGLQMLGRHIADPLGVEGDSPGESRGLGLLPLHTAFAATKQLRQTRERFGALRGPWRALAGIEVNGYEIRAGDTTLVDGAHPQSAHMPRSAAGTDPAPSPFAAPTPDAGHFARSATGIHADAVDELRDALHDDPAADDVLIAALPGRVGWQRGPILALYLHGLFENAAVLRALWNAQAADLDSVFDRLAERLDERFTRATLLNLLDPH